MNEQETKTQVHTEEATPQSHEYGQVLCESKNEKFISLPDGTLLWEKAKTNKDGVTFYISSEIANHTPKVIRYRNVQSTNNVTNRALSLSFSYTKDSIKHSTEVTLPADGLDLDVIKKIRPPEYFIQEGTGYKQAYLRCIQIQCGNVEVKTSYNLTGFVEVDGRLTYINRNYSINSEGIVQGLSSEFVNDDALNKVLGFVNSEHSPEVCYRTVLEELPKFIKAEVLIPALAYVFLAPLLYFLEGTDYLQPFTLFIVGQSGSGKTSLAKLLLNFFGKVPFSADMPLTFQSTSNSNQRLLSIVNDTVALIDDRTKGATTEEEKMFRTMEQNMIFFVANRNGRGRLSQDAQKTQAPDSPRALLIMTGEISYENLGEAARARSISLEFVKDSLNIEKKKAFKDYTDLNVTMQKYIQYLIKNSSGLTEKLIDRIGQFESREEATHARTFGNASFLMLSYSMLLDFFEAEKAISSAEKKSYMDTAVDVIQQVEKHQTEVVIEEKPTRVFLTVLREMIGNNQATVTHWGNKVSSSGNNIGYIKKDIQGEEILLLEPETTFTAVSSFLSKSTRTIMGKSALYKMLRDEGISKCNTSGGYYKTEHLPMVYGGGSRKFLEIPYACLNDDSEESEQKGGE